MQQSVLNERQSALEEAMRGVRGWESREALWQLAAVLALAQDYVRDRTISEITDAGHLGRIVHGIKAGGTLYANYPGMGDLIAHASEVLSQGRGTVNGVSKPVLTELWGGAVDGLRRAADAQALRGHRRQLLADATLIAG